MSLPSPLAVRALGMVCSVGYSAAECHASVRAGVARAATTAVMDRRLEALRMALVPDAGLLPLPHVDTALRSARHRRMLRLGATALTEALDAFGAGPLPVTLVTRGAEAGAALLLDDLYALTDGRFDRAQSTCRTQGSAAVGLALSDVAGALARSAYPAHVVLGVDSLLDLARLDGLQRAGRLLTADAVDGFVPGEGAAAVVLSLPGPRDSLATVAASAVAPDPFTREGDHPLTADGLTEALRAVMIDADAPAADAWLSLNGESWTAREWAVAALRNQAVLGESLAVHHPVEAFGEPGAALGVMLLALAASEAARRPGRGPAVVCTMSEEGLRGALRVEPARSV